MDVCPNPIPKTLILFLSL